ncbi:unnamed protein product, partial [Didymodactylos carnosus]
FHCKQNHHSYDDDQNNVHRSPLVNSCSDSFSNVIQSLTSTSQRKQSSDSLILKKKNYRTRLSICQIRSPISIIGNQIESLTDKHHRLDLLIVSLGIQTSFFFFPVIFLKLDANFNIQSLQNYLSKHLFWYSIAHPFVLLNLTTRICAYCLFDINFRQYFKKVVGMTCSSNCLLLCMNTLKKRDKCMIKIDCNRELN